MRLVLKLPLSDQPDCRLYYITDEGVLFFFSVFKGKNNKEIAFFVFSACFFKKKNKRDGIFLPGARKYSQIKSGPHPELQPAPDKDYRNAYALAFTVFQISVYLSSSASDV